MKLHDILNEATKIKKPKARPKKTLWFNAPEYWKNDLDFARPDHKLYYEDNEETFYALDNEGKRCYGAWYGKKKRGVTFHEPRPRNTLIHPRAKPTYYDFKPQNQ